MSTDWIFPSAWPTPQPAQTVSYNTGTPTEYTTNPATIIREQLARMNPADARKLLLELLGEEPNP